MGQAPVVLDAASRGVVTATVAEVCRHRGWYLFAMNARTNHVHVVVSSPSHTPGEVMATLKAWCTRRLREAGRAASDARVWARHGSTRFLWTEADVEGAVRYVVQDQ
jgi:REP element-mobilizing transposase RayT